MILRRRKEIEDPRDRSSCTPWWQSRETDGIDGMVRLVLVHVVVG